MSWRDKVQTMRDGKNFQLCVPPSLPKPPKPSCVSFGSTPPAPFQEKTEVASHPASHAGVLENLTKPEVAPAANDPMQAVRLAVNPALATLAPDPDRWCWPHSSAMTGREIDTMAERTGLFNGRGLAALEAELLADKLVTRDREGDDRRLCLECAHLAGLGAWGWRCSQWQRTGLGLPAGLAIQLQRCDGFKDQSPRGTP